MIKKKNRIEVFISDTEGQLFLHFLFCIYFIYFLTALVFVGGVTVDMVTLNIDGGNKDISEGKAVLYIFFIGQLIYMMTHPEVFKPIIKNKKTDRIVITSLILGGLILILIRERHRFSWFA